MSAARNPNRIRSHRAFAVVIALPLLAGGCITTGSQEQPQAGVATGKEQAANLMRVGTVTINKGDADSAINMFQRAHALDPQAAEPLVALGHALRAKGIHVEGADAYRRARVVDPANIEAQRSLGYALMGMEQPRQALEAFNAALKMAPRDVRSWNGRGVALDTIGERRAAQEAYRTGMMVDPNDIQLRNNLGLSLALGGDPAEAIVVLEGLTRSAGASAVNRQNLALAYGLAGRDRDAAAISRLDLPADHVQNNIDYYGSLRAQQ